MSECECVVFFLVIFHPCSSNKSMILMGCYSEIINNTFCVPFAEQISYDFISWKQKHSERKIVNCECDGISNSILNRKK